MKKNISKTEGRISRWSRLKLSGDDEAKNEKTNHSHVPTSNFTDAPSQGGIAIKDPILTKKGFVKPMVPLAKPEDGETAYEAAPADAIEMLDIEAASQKENPLRESDEYTKEDSNIELTPEQAEAVRELPSIETLKADSDFTPFFESNVPDYLKRHAFKALWASSPFFNFRDGLDDYDENFRFIDKLITAANSDYKAGEGYGFKDEVEEVDDDIGDGEDELNDEGVELKSDEQEIVVESEKNKDEVSEEKVESVERKDKRKSDVRPPDDAV